MLGACDCLVVVRFKTTSSNARQVAASLCHDAQTDAYYDPIGPTCEEFALLRGLLVWRSAVPSLPKRIWCGGAEAKKPARPYWPNTVLL